MGQVESRLARLEKLVQPPRPGCDHCHLWGRSGIRDDYGYEDPPATCPECGRNRPPVQKWLHVRGVQLGKTRSHAVEGPERAD